MNCTSSKNNSILNILYLSSSELCNLKIFHSILIFYTTQFEGIYLCIFSEKHVLQKYCTRTDTLVCLNKFHKYMETIQGTFVIKDDYQISAHSSHSFTSGSNMVTASANTHAEFVFFMLGDMITQPVCISSILIVTLIKCRVTLTIQSYLVLH